ncbi:protein kinase [Actinomadura sp. NAK00032]|uniref:serine/threonine protein kinase n=1 Tax=Actinomadura sp. NAK00032 TaxID=2742128 RepID=UPI001591C0E7|nr:serine/threonine-protein kinase [Actinomadura sp. NAK00032]QKW38574.1 protein kinase [Actinomadura sp. NAK00032]
MGERRGLLPTDPDSVGPYRLEDRLGAGGQGTVYVGRSADGAPVAVKLLHPHLFGNEVARTRFVREMQIAERVAPFCTAQVLDSGVVDGRPYIVSEFVDGPSLQASVRDTGPRTGAALERLAVNTVTALAAIHRAEVVHRDFKPGNVLLGPDGPVVIDFGIARALDLNQSIITSQAVGTPGYMAPEQIREDETGPAADMFAWGATMVFAATGRRAFDGGSIPAVMRAILEDEPDLGGLRAPFAAIVRECLAKDPAKRPTAADVGERLRDLPSPAWEGGAEPAVSAAPDTVQDSASDAGRSGKGRRRALLIGVAVAAFVVALGGGYVLLPSDGEGRTSEAAETPETATSSGVPATGTTGPPASPSESASREAGPSSATSKAPESGAAPSTGSGSRTPRPSGKPSEPSGGGEEKAPAGPKTLGTISASDGTGYCRSRGYAGAVREYGGDYSCYGAPGRTTVTLTALCRWKYPNHSNVKADGTTCKSQN